jgi:hypothetical protein
LRMLGRFGFMSYRIIVGGGMLLSALLRRNTALPLISTSFSGRIVY